jgi:FKBP-type peptidyl-prolyl cis-trans isomerase SlyD
MKISKESVVFFNFTIKDDKGNELESSEEGPASYIQGIGSALPSIEQALEGQEPGFKTELTLTPDQAFGSYDEELVVSVPAMEFEGQELAVGMEFLSDEDADPADSLCWRVIKITDKEVTLNANHPYAGKTLVFNIEVVNVREATSEELEHGHVHEENS